MTITVANGGSAKPLIRVVVNPHIRENVSARHFFAAMYQGGSLVCKVPARLRRDMLIELPSSGATTVSGGAKDEYDVWSESDETSLTAANFSTDASRQSSIASVATSDPLVEDSSILFPDLSVGTGVMQVWRTEVSDTFYDETRRQKQESKRAAFKIKMIDLDEEQVNMIHRFYSSLRGPTRPFLFDFVDPKTGEHKRYTVRFIDESVSDSLETIDRSDVEVSIVEVVGVSLGGEVV